MVASGEAVLHEIMLAAQLVQALIALHGDEVLELHAGPVVCTVHAGHGLLVRLVCELGDRLLVLVVHPGPSQAKKAQKHTSRRLARFCSNAPVV